MPFIEQWRRDTISKHGLSGLGEVKPGDRCYVYYKELIEAWRKEPKWTTAHNLLKAWLASPCEEANDDAVAKILAWQVFFHRVVMPYEERKVEENGLV